MEASRFGAEEVSGVLVGDGDNLWVYWPAGKPRYPWEYAGEHGAEYEKHQHSSYLHKPTPLGKHSIAHEVGQLGAGMSMTILDPSTFHGYTDSLQPYLDAVRQVTVENVSEEPCDVIEVSLMKGQRNWFLWLARKDHLPRKLKEVVRVSFDIVINETWSQVTVNDPVPKEKFTWNPPAGWKEWQMPSIESGLLRPGTRAPDFELAARDGKTIRLSDFRGNYVWLYKWRSG